MQVTVNTYINCSLFTCTLSIYNVAKLRLLINRDDDDDDEVGWLVGV